jgi:hypothetical protein
MQFAAQMALSLEGRRYSFNALPLQSSCPAHRLIGLTACYVTAPVGTHVRLPVECQGTPAAGTLGWAASLCCSPTAPSTHLRLLSTLTGWRTVTQIQAMPLQGSARATTVSAALANVALQEVLQLQSGSRWQPACSCRW